MSHRIQIFPLSGFFLAFVASPLNALAQSDGSNYDTVLEEVIVSATSGILQHGRQWRDVGRHVGPR